MTPAVQPSPSLVTTIATLAAIAAHRDGIKTRDNAASTAQVIWSHANSLAQDTQASPDDRALGEAITPLLTFAAYVDQPKTLPQWRELFAKVSTIANLRLGNVPAAGGKIGEVLTASSGRPRNFEDAVDRLNRIQAAALEITTASPAVEQSNPYPALIARMRVKEAAASSSPVAAAPTTTASDAQIFDRYFALKGSERMRYFSANRAALIREDGRRATAAAHAVHSDLVTQYMALTGQARTDFYAKHSRELFQAHRARSKQFR